jgi:hypothetical protein
MREVFPIVISLPSGNGMKKQRHGRKDRYSGKIGRLYFVRPSCGERYYLRMLLMVVKGAQSYEYLHTYNGVAHSTFKEACNTQGLLSNDQEWYNAFNEATHWATSNQLRQLFVTMLLFCEDGDEYKFFEHVWKSLADDIQYNVHQTINPQHYQMPNTDLRDQVLTNLSALFERRGRTINEFNLPRATVYSSQESVNRLFDEELNYDADTLAIESQRLIAQLNSEQRCAIDSIVETVLADKLGFFFVSGYEGTGKTFLWNSIITYLRGHRKIVLSVASSGVASLLLPGGHTAHSHFKIPYDDLDEGTTCNIKCGTMLCELIQVASLVIWDEALMTHKIAFEALDRTLRDIVLVPLSVSNKLCFGGKVVVLGGDLRQTLLVVQGGSRAKIVRLAIVNSDLWSYVTVLHLTLNLADGC